MICDSMLMNYCKPATSWILLREFVWLQSRCDRALSTGSSSLLLPFRLLLEYYFKFVKDINFFIPFWLLYSPSDFFAATLCNFGCLYRPPKVFLDYELDFDLPGPGYGNDTIAAVEVCLLLGGILLCSTASIGFLPRFFDWFMYWLNLLAMFDIWSP